MGTLVKPWRKTRRGLSAFVVACFFLPFFGVSCDGIDAVTISGADMIGGCRPGGMVAAMEDESEKRMPGEGGLEVKSKIQRVEVEPFAIAALVFAVAGVGLAWLRTRRGLQLSIAAAALGLAALIALYVTGVGKIHEAVDDMISDQAKDHVTGTGGKPPQIDGGGRLGLWGAALGFLGLAGFGVVALKKPDE